MNSDFPVVEISTSSQESEPVILGRIKNLDTRLAICDAEIRECQRLRYQVFYEEMSAQPDDNSSQCRLDVDKYDEYCDHLLVIDRSFVPNKIVGSYRLLSQENSLRTDGFYSANRFCVSDLLARQKELRFLEFGRSFVLKPYRNKRTIELLWQGSWAHVRQNHVDVMFGCASFEGTDPQALAQALSYLYHHARAKNEWQVRAHAKYAVNMNRMKINEIDARSALRQLPPLIKGYLRLGALIGEEAVIDPQFGTIDIMIILPISHLNPRYVNHYGANAERFRDGF